MVALLVVAGLIVVGVVRIGSVDRASRSTGADEVRASTDLGVDPAYHYETPNPYTPDPPYAHETPNRAFPADVFVNLETGETDHVLGEIRSILNAHLPSEYRVSPDGSMLAFVTADRNGFSRVQIARLDGSHRRIVAVAATTPAW